MMKRLAIAACLLLSFGYLTTEAGAQKISTTQTSKTVKQTQCREQQQQKKSVVSGKVTDEKGNPCMVYVTNKTTKRGMEGDRGKYSIYASPGDILEFYSVGMKTVEKKVTEPNMTINVVLQHQPQELKIDPMSGKAR